MMHPEAAARALVIVGSSGAYAALADLLPQLAAPGDVAVILLLHLPERGMPEGFSSLDRLCAIPVGEAVERAPARGGMLHVAPPGYHLLVERDGCFSYSLHDRERYVRPAADVLLDSAADCWGPHLCACILSGANDDGAQGMRAVRDRGGFSLAQTPAEAQFPRMPRAAIDAGGVQQVATMQELRRELNQWMS